MLVPFDAAEPSDLTAVAAIWTAAYGPDMAISERLVAFNTRAATGALQAGRLIVQGNAMTGNPVGFVLASALPGQPDVSPPEIGWIDAIAVRPDFQRQGAGTALLAWAEEWLRAQGCTSSRLGGSLRPFVPGLPVSLGTQDFFRNRGYNDRASCAWTWDVARDLTEYASPSGAMKKVEGELRPAEPGEENALLAFLQREFPDRWRFDFQEFMRENGRISDYQVLWTPRGIGGFCHLSFEDSWRPMERFYPNRLPRPWGQAGPIGVGADLRGKGYGAAVLDAGLHRLRDSGVRGCVIDWTGLLDFYGRFGFAPYRHYAMLLKSLF